MKLISNLLFLLSISISVLYGQRKEINLNHNWQFSKSGSPTQIVTLPHTWNYDALGGQWDYFRGLGSYIKEIKLSAQDLKDSKAFLRFGAANSRAVVYVNSRYVGEHKGGYTAFGWDITPFLNVGNNYIWVRVNNSQDMGVMPLIGDFNHYGGIYRDVELILTPKTHISLADYASSGIYVTAEDVSQHSARVRVEATINTHAMESVDAQFTIFDDLGGVVATKSQTIESSNVAVMRTVAADFTIDSPQLWNSTENPYLYSAEVKLVDQTNDGACLDSISENFGLRYWEVNAQNQFSLNGKPLRIKGVTRFEDNALRANALYRENHQRDIELMLEMGVNAVRLTHYPQDPYFLDLCDKAGIMVWSEIPFVGAGGERDKGFIDSPEFMDNGEVQLTEMIKQLYNHPSILWWGLFDELTQRGDDPKIYIRELMDLAGELDPTRECVAASNQDGELNFITPLIGFNQYVGWNEGSPKDLELWAKSLRREWPNLKVALSEYGAGGSPYLYSDTIVRPELRSTFHPSTWQSHYHQSVWRIINEGNYFWGTFINSMFDYGVAPMQWGDRPGVSDMGLVSFDRLTRKDAFYFYKANWNATDQFVHIARSLSQTKASSTIVVYSNSTAVELIVDGVSYGEKYNNGYGTFTWEGVKLKKGKNEVSVYNLDLTKSDSEVFELQ